jgi:adenylate kinase
MTISNLIKRLLIISLVSFPLSISSPWRNLFPPHHNLFLTLFLGTMSDATNAEVPSGVLKTVKKEKIRSFKKYLLASDVVIYDLMTSDPEEVEFVIKTLRNSDSEKTLILISSVMTWANTPAKQTSINEDDENDPENLEAGDIYDDNGQPTGKKILPFKESHYHLRVPPPKFQNFKTLETLALSGNNKGNLTTYVICAGLIYGNGENVFYSLFRKAWLSTSPSLPYIGSGMNRIPTVHITDLTRIIQRVVDLRPDS